MLPHDPLLEAARLSTLAALKRAPDPASDFARANALGNRTIHPFHAEKEVFDAFHRAFEAAVGRRMNQAEAFRLIVACALRHQDEVLAEARRAARAPPVA